MSFSIITQVIIEMRALWFIEDYVISRYNITPREVIINWSINFQNGRGAIPWCFIEEETNK